MKDILKISIISEILIFVLVIATTLMEFYNFSLIMLLISSVLLIMIARFITNNFFSLAVFFSGFHVLYGVSGLISVIWGNGLPSIWGTEFHLSSYFVMYSLCSIGLVLGMYLYHIFGNRAISISKKNTDHKFFLLIAFLIVSLTTIFELINFIRVGGIDTLFMGKAIYQGKVSSLILTLPSSIMFEIAISFLGVYFIFSNDNNPKKRFKTIAIFCLIALPYLLLTLFLGQRGKLLSYIIIILLIYGYKKPVKVIGKKLILIAIVCYLGLATLTATRPIIKGAFEDFGAFTELLFKKERWITALNPGTNEFGCTFGNFNKLYISSDYEYLYGESYLRGLTSFVPSYLYPGDKPQSLTYQFRDTYFKKEAERSRIAGTALSSVLEAFWNFSYFGSIMYIIYGFLIMKFDLYLRNKNIFNLIYYFATSPFLISFHRSDFGDIVSDFILKAIVIFAIYLFYKFIFKKHEHFFKKVIESIEHPSKIIIYLMNKNFFFLLNDKLYLKLKFRLIMGYKLNLKNPKTFNEKLQWLKLYDRNPLYTKMVDKAEAKEYVSKIIGEEYIIKTLGVYNNFKEIDFTKLPNQFVLKPTHASGHVFICKDKSKIDYKKLEKKVNKWLKINYYKVHREWPYKNVKPRIIIEEYINELSDSDLRDYKFFVFNNKFKYSFVCSDRLKDLKFTFFDSNGKFLDFTQDGCLNDSNIKLPDNYQKMIKLAEKLSKDTIQIRVDFYSLQGKIYFGELTFYDAAGFGKFEPSEWDLRIGNWLKLEGLNHEK